MASKNIGEKLSRTFRSQEKSVLYVESAPGAAGGEETAIVAQITVPEEGGWGWVVVFTSFLSIAFLDGCMFTYGSLFSDIRDDMEVGESLVALINSVAFAVYFMLGPIASAIINRYGFRECNMIGSVICSFSLLGAYFAHTYAMLFVCYGLFCGFGACLINMSSSLVVGFYFDRLRSLVLSISGSGSNVGCMVMYSVNSYLVELGGWRLATLIHSGMLGLIYFLSMTYIPIVPLIVTTEEEAVTVTNLPSFTASRIGQRQLAPTATERMFNTVSSPHFPTAATMVSRGVLTTAQSSAKPSTSERKNIKLTLSTVGQTAATQRQMKKVQSVVSQHAKMTNIEVQVDIDPPKKLGFWSRLCHWKKHVSEARPMYKDDVFYCGRIDQLPEYKKSVVDTTSKGRFPIEYHLAVARTAEATDLAQKGICTTAMKRILVTMIDLTLLRKCSMLIICTSGFFTYSGLLVPYIFLQERNKLEGLPPEHCSRIISFIGFTNTVGKLIIGALACKLSVTKLYIFAVVMAGIAAIGFNFSFTLYYQYSCAGVFGFFIASLQPMRSILLVQLYGLEMLTNASGLMLMCQGIGCLIGTPMASVIKNNLGYTISFWVAGSSLILSGLILVPVQTIAKRESPVTNTENVSTSC